MQCGAPKDTEKGAVRGRRWRNSEKGKKGIYAVTEEVGTAREPPLTSCPKQPNFV